MKRKLTSDEYLSLALAVIVTGLLALTALTIKREQSIQRFAVPEGRP